MLDRDDIPLQDIIQNMKELDTINSRLGGHNISIRAFKEIISKTNQEVIHVAEIGCGGGDNLRALKNYCTKNNINASFTGIDINPHCIAYAQSRIENEGITFIPSDYRSAFIDDKPDIIFSSLFCHHFTGQELAEQFIWMKENSKIGFFINDLHRQPVAYYSIQLLTQVFSKSYLVKNDAPLSVLRGFIKTELAEICATAGLQNVRIQWNWAFRWLLIFTHAN